MNKANGEELEDLNVLFPGEESFILMSILVNPPDLSDDTASEEIVDISPTGSTSPALQRPPVPFNPSLRQGFVHVCRWGWATFLGVKVYFCYLRIEPLLLQVTIFTFWPIRLPSWQL